MIKKELKVTKYLSVFMLAAYLLLLIYLTFFSHYFGRGERLFRSLNLVPFRTILFYFNPNMSFINSATNLAGNVLAFLPMGFLLPLTFKKMRYFRKVLLVSFLATLTIETGQYLLIVGSCDIDDVILNLAGGVIGFISFKLCILLVNFFRRDLTTHT